MSKMAAAQARKPVQSPMASAKGVLQRKCGSCRKKKPILQRVAVSSAPETVPPIVHEVLRSPGQPLDPDTRAFMEPRFGYDFSRVRIRSNALQEAPENLEIGSINDPFEQEADYVADQIVRGSDRPANEFHDFSQVRIHTGERAAESARALNALAYTMGNDIVFGAGRYAPAANQGQWLIAHELTHVIQQAAGAPPRVQRGCSDPNFCTPYPTTREAESAKWWLRNTYMRAEGIETFGTEVKNLYERFLNRRPGDSLDPVVFRNESSYLVTAFKESGDTTDDMDSVIDLVGDRLDRAPGPPLRNGVAMTMSLANFLSTAEMANRPINYSNPFSVAGHTAGDIGSSAAGPDYRKITYANVTLEKTTLIGSTGYVSVRLIPHYEVFDAIDFCPGDCGSPVEQLITVPMSRLEASGEAYDVPFKVIFSPEPRSKRFWF